MSPINAMDCVSDALAGNDKIEGFKLLGDANSTTKAEIVIGGKTFRVNLTEKGVRKDGVLQAPGVVDYLVERLQAHIDGPVEPGELRPTNFGSEDENTAFINFGSQQYTLTVRKKNKPRKVKEGHVTPQLAVETAA